jgi:hypothetical protein
MRFVAEQMTLEEVFLLNFSSFPQLIIIPPLFHTQPSLPPEVCNSLDQAAHYHNPSLSFWGSICDLAPG